MKRTARLTVLGGAREIGANSIFLDLGGSGLLLDAGMHPRLQGREALPAFDQVTAEVDAIFISHAHLDHVGALPEALKCFPRAQVYMTGPTSLLSLRMLRNAVAVSRHLSRGPERPEPLFTFDEVEWLEQVLRTRELGSPLLLDNSQPDPPTLTFLNAGHILGAAGILIEHRSRRIFYSGDTCGHSQYICRRAEYPDPPIDLLILDSTHGADPDPQIRRDRRAFGRAITELAEFISATAARGGSVLMPVFALGRTQEMLGILHGLRRQGRIPPLPIYISGLAHAVSRIYDATRKDSARHHSELILEELSYTVLQHDRLLDPDLLSRPSILAVTSGMMFLGTSSHALSQRVLSDPRHGVAFVGYLDPETPGYAVAQAEPQSIVGLGGGLGPVRVACPVRRFDFTAHSRASQLMETVSALRPTQVVLVHGESAAVDTLRTRLQGRAGRVTVAEPGSTLEF